MSTPPDSLVVARAVPFADCPRMTAVRGVRYFFVVDHFSRHGSWAPLPLSVEASRGTELGQAGNSTTSFVEERGISNISFEFARDEEMFVTSHGTCFRGDHDDVGHSGVFPPMSRLPYGQCCDCTTWSGR